MWSRKGLSPVITGHRVTVFPTTKKAAILFVEEVMLPRDNIN